MIRTGGGGADFRGGVFERLATQVRHAHFHAQRGEFRRRRQANAAGRSGYDRDPVRGQRGMIGRHEALRFSKSETLTSRRAGARKPTRAPLTHEDPAGRDRARSAEAIGYNLAQPKFNCR